MFGKSRLVKSDTWGTREAATNKHTSKQTNNQSKQWCRDGRLRHLDPLEAWATTAWATTACAVNDDGGSWDNNYDKQDTDIDGVDTGTLRVA